MNRSCAPQSFKFLFLENAQEFGLKLKRYVAHLIEKESAPMGQLKPAYDVGRWRP